MDGGKSRRSNRVAVENKEREGVYPPIAKENLHKDKEIKGICSVPLDDDETKGRPVIEKKRDTSVRGSP
jgi:hypothetical protein